MFLKMKTNVHRALNICQAIPKCFLYVIQFSQESSMLSYLHKETAASKIPQTSLVTQQVELGRN